MNDNERQAECQQEYGEFDDSFGGEKGKELKEKKIFIYRELL